MDPKRMPTVLVAGDVVQIDPSHDELFGGCFLLITEVKSWGIVGFVKLPGQGEAYYRAPFAAIYLIGKAEWVPTGVPEDPPEPT